MKDSLVVPTSGAEVIPFIKVWVMFPCSLLLTYIFTRLSNRFSRETVFYSMLSIFLGYFLLFVAVIYPSREGLHPHQFATALSTTLPEGFKGFIAMFRYWTFTSFYVMSELWSNIILSMLFWGFANEITHVGEAKRFYGLLGVGANISGVAAGALAMGISSYFGKNQWESEMFTLIAFVTLAGLIVMGVFYWMNRKVLTDPRFYTKQEEERAEVRGRMSMRENFAYLFKSKYLIYIAVIVIAYNLVINLVEVLWKNQVRELYPNASEYNLFMNQVMAVIGVFATAAAYLISGNAIRKCGWTFTAMLTPLILFITSVGFFFFFFLKEHPLTLGLAFGGLTPLGMVVFFGTAQNVLSRSAKYSVFDATKEMAFVPLDPESKLKGKAAIDGVCNRMGKAGGSVIHQTLLISLSTLAAGAPYVCAFLLIAILVWMWAVKALGKQFNLLAEEKKSDYPVVASNDRSVLKSLKHQEAV